MPTVIIPLHDLYKRRAEVPRKLKDCYLTAMTRDGEPATEWDAPDEDGAYVQKFMPIRNFDILPDEDDEDDDGRRWTHIWCREEGDTIRIGSSVAASTDQNPILCTFIWGEGHPKEDGVEMLPHEVDVYTNRCCWCRGEAGVQDCPERRLQALAAATTETEKTLHIKAVHIWHSAPSRPEAIE